MAKKVHMRQMQGDYKTRFTICGREIVDAQGDIAKFPSSPTRALR
jgi:hypothetical protein